MQCSGKDPARKATVQELTTEERQCIGSATVRPAAYSAGLNSMQTFLDTANAKFAFQTDVQSSLRNLYPQKTCYRTRFLGREKCPDAIDRWRRVRLLFIARSSPYYFFLLTVWRTAAFPEWSPHALFAEVARRRIDAYSCATYLDAYCGTMIRE
jgi:hypothetical protein